MMEPLYDTDFFTWTQQQAALLREGKFHDLDLENLAEEIESLGKRDRRAVEHQLERLVKHLLKWRYQARRQSRSWRQSIWTARRAILRVVADSQPSLQPQVPDLLTKHYPAIRRYTAQETRLPLTTFPEVCPWTVEQILDEEFWPDATP
jgi:hypothetical protein